ncbi:MAG: hypothetical protein NWS80_05470 [Akkermansiaceae bacterium]|jgi:hypothetical protein|nr:hypothetical protein [Akkermansiaceae bacterium]
MLRIPEEGEVGAPLMAPIQKIAFSSTPEPNRKQKRGKRKRKKDSVTPDWESGKGKKDGEGIDWKGVFKTTVVWGISFGVIAGGVFFFLKTTEPAPELVEIVVDPDAGKAILETPVSLTAGFDEEELVPTGLLKRSEAELLNLVEPLAQKFLEAETVEEILPLVRNPYDVAQKMRRLHPDGTITPLGFSGVSPLEGVSYKDGYAAVSFLTADQEKKPMVFCEGEGGLKIDWESWAGWSELPWDELMESKPTKPVLVRVISKPVPYYNFGFSDEDEWVSYRLLSPDGEHTLYGYAKRGSLIDEQLRPADPNGAMAVTLRISFREGATSASQAEIDEFVTDGWVISADSN